MMIDSKLNTLAVAAALAGAVSIATAAAPTAAVAQDQEQCWGVALAGENDCGNAAGTHSCAGQSETDYHGGDWKLVTAGTCEGLGGSLESFEGRNPNFPAPQ